MSSYCRIFLIGLATLISSAVSTRVAFANVRLAFDSTSLNYGNVALSGTRTLTLEVWDTSSSDIEIDRFDLTGSNPGDFSFTSDSTTPFVVRADSGNNVKIYVTFSPTANGQRTGFLELETSDGNVFISLSGRGGLNTGLEWSCSSIDFGLLGPDGEKNSIIELYSTGKDSVSISLIEMATGDLSFAVRTVSGVQPPFTLGPGDSIAVDVSFQGLLPTGEKGAQLTVYGATLNNAECNLMGDVEYGNFSIVPETVDFGTMYAGQIRDTIVMVENTGAVPIPIDMIRDIGLDPDADDFTLLNPLDTLFVIPPGSELPLIIRANPGLNTSHTSQLSAASKSGDTNYKSATLIVSVVRPSLTSPPNQTLSFFCAVGAPQQLTLPISDTGSGSIVITSFVSSDPNVIVTINPAIPDTLASGEAQSVSVQFDPSKAVSNNLIIEGLGGEKVMIADTVSLQPEVSFAAASISSLPAQSGTQANFNISTSTALTQFGIDTIIVHVSVADTNIASISTPDIKLSPALSNDTITAIEPEPGGYVVTIVSSSPITLAAGSPLLTVGFSRFVSIADSSDVFVAIETPEKTGCLDWNSDSAYIQGASACGSPLMQFAMSGTPIILTATLRENPVTDGIADVSILSNVASQAHYSITNAIGQSLSDGSLDLVAGQNNPMFSLAGCTAGAYILRIVTADGYYAGLRLLKL